MDRANLHSSIVATVKVVLPLVAIALLSSLFLFSRQPDPDAALPYADIDVEQVLREQRLTQPRYAGVVEDGRELIIMAENAAIEDSQTDRIRAQSIDGRMEQRNNAWIDLEALSGEFDMTAQRGFLSGNVLVESSRGYVLESEALEVALNRTELISHVPVEINGPEINLTAGNMMYLGPDGATMVYFSGSVRVLYGAQN